MLKSNSIVTTMILSCVVWIVGCSDSTVTRYKDDVTNVTHNTQGDSSQGNSDESIVNTATGDSDIQDDKNDQTESEEPTADQIQGSETEHPVEMGGSGTQPEENTTTEDTVVVVETTDENENQGVIETEITYDDHNGNMDDETNQTDNEANKTDNTGEVLENEVQGSKETLREGTYYTKLSEGLYLNEQKDVVIYLDQDLNKSAKLIYDTAKIKEITKRLYDKLEDKFDFIFLVTNNKERPKSVTYAGVFSKVKNDVEGIGAPLYDNTSHYGSNGRLMGVMHFAYRRAILSGPTLHEISHYWANKFRFDENDANGYRLGSGSHWGYNGFFGGKGQLGGYDATTFKDEEATFTSKKGKEWHLYSAASFGWNANGGNGLPYNDVELYLMGMLPKDEVKDMLISKPWGSPSWPASNQYIKDHNLPLSGRKYFMAQEVVRKSWSDILSEHAIPERSPSVTTSQKHFRILTVLLDTTMPKTYEVNAISKQIKSLAYRGDDGNDHNYNFYEATRGMGSLSVSDIDNAMRESGEQVLIAPTYQPESVTWRGLNYQTVKSPYTGRIWLDRNLGATRVCQSFDDRACYGGLFAFGRGMDGHQKRTSPIVQERFDTVTPERESFVVVGHNTTLVDWVVAGVDDDLSKRHAFVTDDSGAGLCPRGFRLPTIDEFYAETSGNEVRDPFPGDTIGVNFLKLPMNGSRLSQTTRTSFYRVGTQGSYWSSSVNEGKVRHLLFDKDVTITYATRYMSNGEGVRCIKAEKNL